MPLIILPTCSPNLVSSSRLSPNILIATSCLMPVSNSLLRIWIGCDISASNPGIVWSVSSIFSMSSSVVSVEVHSAFGLSEIMMSALSTGIGSVGISALPIRLTTCFTSGYSAFSSFSALVQLSTICEREVPCDILISTAKSPSSKLGINSPPRNLNATRLTQNKATAPVITFLFCFSTQLRTGRYHCCIFLTILSAKVSFLLIFLLRKRLLAIGTYVSDNMKAPSMAKNTVRAIGRNILPSMPTKVIKGTYTIIIMISPKAALCLIREAEK